LFRDHLASTSVTRALRLAVLFVTLALVAAPGAALAQNGAGDEQYQDPFGSQQSGSSSGSGSGSSGSLSQAPPSAGSPAAPQSAAASPAPLPGELARTGGDLRIVLGAGIVLLIGGLALRRRADGR
jgi:hypothetical protein